MDKIITFKEIIAWQKAHTLVLSVYKVTKQFPKEELYALVNQMRRAVVSVPANIVEGYKRQGVADSVRFYNISEASLEEIKYFILLSRDLEYINLKDSVNLINQSEEVGRVLHGWIESQRQYIQ